MPHLYAIVTGNRKQKVCNAHLRLDDLSDEQCKRTTRFPKSAVKELCDIVGDDVEHVTARSNAMPVDTQVLTALQFYASGSFQWMIGRSCGLSQSSVSLAIDAVTKALVKRAPSLISFPK